MEALAKCFVTNYVSGCMVEVCNCYEHAKPCHLDSAQYACMQASNTITNNAFISFENWIPWCALLMHAQCIFLDCFSYRCLKRSKANIQANMLVQRELHECSAAILHIPEILNIARKQVAEQHINSIFITFKKSESSAAAWMASPMWCFHVCCLVQLAPAFRVSANSEAAHISAICLWS